MAESIVSSTVTTLGNLLNEEANFLLGVEDQVELLKEELSWLQRFLKDADAKQDEDERVRKWVDDIRDAAYDAEDVIVTFARKIASRRRKGIINVLKRSATIFSEMRTHHQAGSAIQRIRSKLSYLISALLTYGLKDSSSDERQLEQLELRPSLPDNVVGLGESIQDLVNHLVAEDQHFRTLSVCGMGGLGKTTLARKIYQHSQVRLHFDYFAWVCVSQNCERREVWQEILFSLTSPSDQQRNEITNLTDDEQLAQKLHQFLKEKKCLVVLDDIWSVSAWDTLRPAFPILEETGTKIMLTSRNIEVALYADPKGFLHELCFLNEKESWELFQKIAISGREDTDFIFDCRMENLAKNMLKHCAGLPLAIVVLGGILATKYSLNDWLTVHDNIKSYLLRSGEIGVFHVLTLSYIDLPTELRLFLLYLSHFPEDSEINVDKLIRMWVAEGFTTLVHRRKEETEEEESMEDVAERYLNELIARGVVLVGKRDASLRTKTCHMHDLMRDFCLLKAEQENFLNIIDYQHVDQNVGPSSSSTSRRLAVHLHGRSCQFPLDYITSMNLRSLLCFYDFSDESWRLHKPIFNNLKLLRVLDLEGADIGEGHLPKDVGELIHLRYLSLRYARVSQIPSSVGNLRYLQTLDLLIRGRSVAVPNVIWKMKQLRHLYLPELCDAKTKLRLDNLTNLRTLVNFPAQNCDVRDLFSMTNLRELTIREPISIKHFTRFLKSLSIKLKHLRALSFDNSYDEDDREATEFEDFQSVI